MFGFGSPASRQARREWWRRQIRRQKGGTRTVAEFCRRLGVSTVAPQGNGLGSLTGPAAGSEVPAKARGGGSWLREGID